MLLTATSPPPKTGHHDRQRIADQTPAQREEAVLAEVMGPSTAGLGDLRNVQLTVAGPSWDGDAMSGNQRGNPVTGRQPPDLREA